jgi:apolipoprotein D and lipocalin family protein
MDVTRMRKDFVLALVLILAAGDASAQTASLPNASVPALDLQRYAGEWHEIAHLPMFFQRNCVANITATYTLRPAGTIGVRNACDGKDGKRMVSEGTARPVAGHPGRLEVRFAPDWLAAQRGYPVDKLVLPANTLE